MASELESLGRIMYNGHTPTPNDYYRVFQELEQRVKALEVYDLPRLQELESTVLVMRAELNAMLGEGKEAAEACAPAPRPQPDGWRDAEELLRLIASKLRNAAFPSLDTMFWKTTLRRIDLLIGVDPPAPSPTAAGEGKAGEAEAAFNRLLADASEMQGLLDWILAKAKDTGCDPAAFKARVAEMIEQYEAKAEAQPAPGEAKGTEGVRERAEVQKVIEEQTQRWLTPWSASPAEYERRVRETLWAVAEVAHAEREHKP